jgi:hypothetical protein
VIAIALHPDSLPLVVDVAMTCALARRLVFVQNDRGSRDGWEIVAVGNAGPMGIRYVQLARIDVGGSTHGPRLQRLFVDCVLADDIERHWEFP